MLFRRQDVIDNFEANFRVTEDDQILFQPPKADIGIPITWEEHANVMAAFEQNHRINMVINLAVFFGAGAVGFYYLLSEGRYVPFFIALGAAFIFSSALQFRDAMGLLLPFIQRRDELLKNLKQAGAVSGKFES